MSTYKCNTCYQLFKFKNEYQRHISKKKSCKKMEKSESKFECPQCNKTFKNKYNLNRHLIHSCPLKKSGGIPPPKPAEEFLYSPNSNNHIDLDNQEHIDNILYEHQNTSKKKYICNYCRYNFTRADSLNKHINKTCKIKQKYDNDKEDLFKMLLKQQNKIDALEKQLNNKSINNINNNSNTNTNNGIINNNINNGVINNNNYNIKLVAFGKEDLSFISEKDYKAILDKGFESVQTLVKYIHFNKGKPENHNIYISNLRDSYIMVFTGKQWEVKERSYVLNELYASNRDKLSDKFDELEENLPEKTSRKFNRFLNDEKDKKVSNNIKNQLKLMLYNKRHMVNKDSNLEIPLLKT